MSTRTNVLDRIANAIGLNGGPPDDPSSRLEWFCGQTDPGPETKAQCFDFVSFGYRRMCESPIELWTRIQSLEACHGRSCIDFSERYGLGSVAAGQNVDLDFVVEQHALAVEQDNFQREQSEAARRFEERRAASERASQHRQRLETYRRRLAELKTLGEQLTSERDACQQSLNELFDPANGAHLQMTDLRRLVELTKTIAACDSAAKVLPGLLKSAEAKLSAFEKQSK